MIIRPRAKSNNLSSSSSGTLAIANGGTGATSAVNAAVNLSADYVVTTLAALKALTARPATVTNQYRATAGDGGGGTWVWRSGNQSSNVSADTESGLWAAPDTDSTGASGAWQRQYDGLANVCWFGAVGDGVADSTDALVAAAASGLSMFVPAGTYLCSEQLELADNVVWEGAGGTGYQFTAQTKLLFTGTGANSVTLDGDFTSPISVANPAAGAAYLADSGTRGDTYTMLDLTAAMSVAVVIGKASGLRGLGIYPNFSGVSGYLGSSADLSDDWDVGVWCRNADNWLIEDCSVQGHWRKAALLVTNSDIGDGLTPSAQYGKARGSYFQGFNGISIRSPNASIGAWGFAGTNFIDCEIRSLTHQSAHLATSSQITTPFSAPSAGMEMSGYGMRGIKFLNCTFLIRDDVAIAFGDVNEMQFIGCYAESKSVKVSGSWVSNSHGSRIVATSDTAGVQFRTFAQYGIDFSDYYTRDGSLTTSRYTGYATGVCSPATMRNDDYDEMLFATKIGPRLRSSAQSFSVLGSAGSDVFSVNDSSHATAGLVKTGTVTVADDAAESVATPKNAGYCLITFCGGSENSAFPSVSHSGIVFYDTGTTVSAGKIGGGASFDVVATDVTGTTGTDGRVTVGVIAGNLRIENRQGGSGVFRYTFLS